MQQEERQSRRGEQQAASAGQPPGHQHEGGEGGAVEQENAQAKRSEPVSAQHIERGQPIEEGRPGVMHLEAGIGPIELLEAGRLQGHQLDQSQVAMQNRRRQRLGQRMGEQQGQRSQQ